MRIIILPRGGGKTTKAIKFAKKKDALLLVHCIPEMLRIKRIDPDINVTTYDHHFNTFAGLKKTNLVIDNADLFMQYMCRRFFQLEIDTITMTGNAS